MEKLATRFGAPRRQADEPRRTAALEVTGERAALLLQGALSINVAALAPGDSRPCFLLGPAGKVLGSVLLKRSSSAGEPPRFLLRITSGDAVKAVRWLKYLSDGYIVFEESDLLAKVEGPAVIKPVEEDTPGLPEQSGEANIPIQNTPVELYKNGFASWFDLSKLFFVGQNAIVKDIRPESKKKEFRWEPDELPLRRTVLYEEHKKLTNRIIPFAGWEMPVWYTSIGEEHRAVRNAAGLFDVSHMGVLEVEGEHAARFLDSVAANYVPRLIPGQSHYSYLLNPDGGVIDDIMVYCRAQDRFMVVVNAANAEKDLAWLLAVNSGEVLIDREHPWKEPEGKAVIRNLKDPSCGTEMRLDIALQGPASLPTILALADGPGVKRAIRRMLRTEFIETKLAGIPVLLSRTGYTGEDIAFELYLHPDQAPRLWRLILEKGKPFGVIPTGLGARDSTRTEAGLPLYGHELAGKHGINPIEAGYAGFVKFHKPYFIGRKPLIESLEKRKMKVARFTMLSRGIRVVKSGDPVVNRRGEAIGEVTSCAAVDGLQLGLCFIRTEYANEGERLSVFILSREGTAPEEKRKDSLKPGDKVLLAEPAIILNRYPRPGSFARTAEVKGEEE
ncbi:MAG: glycine cleavage system aminomethyltransferase GcvT [bacterium]